MNPPQFERITQTGYDGKERTFICRTKQSCLDLDKFHKEIMPYPYNYQILDLLTRKCEETNTSPRLDQLKTYQPTGNPNERILTQTKECYIDVRYEAKVRLYRYLLKKHGIDEMNYNPFDGTEIGKSESILNF